MLDASNISVIYGDQAVLDSVSVAIQANEVVAVLGANGAGKTTLLRVLNGAVIPISGDVRLDGDYLGEFSRRQTAKRITVVAQENETKFPMTVLEFVLAGRFAYGGGFGFESDEDREVALSSLELCGLKAFSGRLMNELSGGERQRVLLARAFATEARILLLDEPTNNLDIANQALILRLVRERCATRGSSAVIVTHDLNLASEFADRVLLLSEGRVVADGMPVDVLTVENIAKVFGMQVLVDKNPRSQNVRITPIFVHGES